MEPMECDDVWPGNAAPRAPSYSNTVGGRLDLSDMDVDPSSPGNAASSSCQGLVNKVTSSQQSRGPGNSHRYVNAFSPYGFDSIWKTGDTGTDNDCQYLYSGQQQQQQQQPLVGPKSTPGFLASHLPTWEPTLNAVIGSVKMMKAVKPGHGMPDCDDTFSPFPENNHGAYNEEGCSIRQRQGQCVNAHEESSAIQQEMTETDNIDTVGYHTLSHIKGPPLKKLKSSPGKEDNNSNLANKSVCEIKNKKQSSTSSSSCCKRFLKFLLVLSVSVLLASCVGAWMRKKCKQSREFDRQSLEIELDSYIFGQKLASQIVITELENYFQRLKTDSPIHQDFDFSPEAQNELELCKPLVLSFHGGTGVGKNFMSRKIADNFANSKLTSFVIPHIFPHKMYDETYSQQIEDWIVGNVTTCEVNIFILDEMDKAGPGVVGGLVRAVSSLTSPCRSTSPILFILLSNSEAVDINRKYIQTVTNNYQPSSAISIQSLRDDLAAAHFIDIFSSAAQTWHTPLQADKDVAAIDSFVPFLPLEASHVRQCILRDIMGKGLSSNAATVDRIMGELSFTTLGHQVHVSNTGCKRVMDKVDYVMLQGQG